MILSQTSVILTTTNINFWLFSGARSERTPAATVSQKLRLRNLLLAIPHEPAKVRVPLTAKALFNEANVVAILRIF